MSSILIFGLVWSHRHIFDRVHLFHTDLSVVLSNIPNFPVTLSEAQGLSLLLTGAASYGVTCAPLSTDRLTITYTDEGSVEPEQEETYDVTALALNSIT